MTYMIELFLVDNFIHDKKYFFKMKTRKKAFTQKKLY